MKRLILVLVLSLSIVGVLNAQQAPRPLPTHAQKMNPATRLGWMYYRGIGTKRNYKKAYHWFEKGAINGDEQALFFQAAMLQRGRGVKRDEKQAFAILYDLAHKYANPHAAFRLAIAYEMGIGCEIDPAQSKRWLDFAAENGVPPAQLKKGLSLLETQPNQGASYVQQAAQNPHFRWSQYQLALLYANGTGVEKDTARAMETMQQAAQLRLPAAQWQLAQWYEQGFAGTPDLEQAFHWTSAAAQSGVLDAQKHLANIYQSGIGISVNLKQAKYWEKQAAKTAKKKPQKREEFY